MLEQNELILATNNAHKVGELSRLLPDLSLRTPRDLGIDFHHRETGRSFLENALGKAAALYAMIQRPVLADDSGLCCSALQGEPGIYSARYGSRETGKALTDRGRIDYLLARMEAHQDRGCFFVCCMVLMVETHRFVTAQETVSGLLAAEPAGRGGFGYDPVFYLPHLSKTMAQLSDHEKDRISHRGRAAGRIHRLIEGS